MHFYAFLRRFFALFGIHAEKLSKHPATTVLGLAQRRIDLILDVGANTGQFAREMRIKFPAARIVSFEPLPEAFAELEAWARADGNAIACQVALGAIEGQLPINLHVDHPTSSSLLEAVAAGIRRFPHMERTAQLDVAIRRLDDVLAELGVLPGPGTLLKLDVQGFEAEALRGAPMTLGRIEALITEVNIDPMYHGQAEFMDLVRLADAGGLRYAGNFAQFLAPDGHVIFLDAVFVR